jgi:hypothetical protein
MLRRSYCTSDTARLQRRRQLTSVELVSSHATVSYEVVLGAVYTHVFRSRFSVRDGSTTQLLPLLFSRNHAREKQREQLGGGTIADGETRAKNASGNGPLRFAYTIGITDGIA